MTYPPGGGQWRPPGPPPQYPPPQYPPPPYGPPRYGPPFGAPPPPRKPPGSGRTVAIVLAALAAFLVVSLVGVVVVHTLSARADVASPSTESPPPATYSALPSVPTYSTPSPTTTVAPTTLPQTTLAPTAPPATQPPSPPPPPPPPSPQPVAALGDNPLFGDVGLPRVQCSWPAWQADLAAQRAFYTAVNACLDKAWAPVLAARNLPFTPPKLVVFDQPLQTSGRCGSGVTQPDVPNFECDDTIYVPSRYLPDVEHILPASFDVFLEIAAHEYGHYVQHLSGVLDAYGDQRQAAGINSNAGLLLSRRLELQAQCFSGMFFAAVLSDQDFHDAKVDAYLRGDYEGTGRKEDHGTPERSGAWFTQGGEKNSALQCNTWTVSPDAVQ